MSDFNTGDSACQNVRKDTPIYEKTSALLAQGRIKDCILFLSNEESANPEVSQKVRMADSTYNLLLQYFLDGVEDESRSDQLNDIKNLLLDAASVADRSHLIPVSDRTYYAESRLASYRPTSLSSLLSRFREVAAMLMLQESAEEVDPKLRNERDTLLSTIFNYVWTLGIGDREELRILRDVVLGNSEGVEIVSVQILSALYLALNEWYDREKFLTLLSIYESTVDERIAARTLTLIILVMAQYGNRISSDRKIMERLQGLRDSLVSYRRLREIIRVLVRTRDTDRISRIMQTELMPNMLKMGPDMLNRLKEASRQTGLDALEENPEWEEMMEKSGMAEKLRELTEIQMEGGDVLMFAFSNLKGFPFFRYVPNWFIPFFLNHGALAQSQLPSYIKEQPGFKLMMGDESAICDSDKYSLMLSMSSIPEAQRSAMFSQLPANIDKNEFSEAMGSLPKSSRPEFDLEAEKFAKNLYRFFKLFPKRNEFFDPFEKPLDFVSLPAIGELMREEEIIALIANFYFRRGYHTEAIPMFKMLIKAQGGDHHLWEHLGYSLEKTGDIKGALEAYMKAELFNPGSRWLLRRTGEVYRALGNLAMAEDYLQRAFGETEEAEELTLLADILREQGKIEDAKRLLYKIDYLHPGNLELNREIARIEAESGNFEKALDRVRPLTRGNASDEDLRLEGDILFLMRRFSEAAESYRHTIHPDQKRREWKGEILRNFERLENLGGRRDEMLLLLESLL